MNSIIDFYILDATKSLKSLAFACRLVEQAYLNQQQVYIHTADKEEAQRIDNLLWTYRDESFIPHQLYLPRETPSAPVQIGFDEPPVRPQQLLVNLHPAFPSFYQQFVRVIEFVFAGEAMQQLARERYRQYRALGSNICTHKIQASEI